MDYFIATGAAAVVSFLLWGPKMNSQNKQSRMKGAPVGIFNEGSTCYINCLLQALSSCDVFVDWLRLMASEPPCDHPPPTCPPTPLTSLHNSRRRLQRVVFDTMLALKGQNDSSPHSSSALLQSMSDMARCSHTLSLSQCLNRQQDAHEFFLALLDFLCESWATIETSSGADSTGCRRGLCAVSEWSNGDVQPVDGDVEDLKNDGQPVNGDVEDLDCSALSLADPDWQQVEDSVLVSDDDDVDDDAEGLVVTASQTASIQCFSAPSSPHSRGGTSASLSRSLTKDYEDVRSLGQPQTDPVGEAFPQRPLSADLFQPSPISRHHHYTSESQLSNVQTGGVLLRAWSRASVTSERAMSPALISPPLASKLLTSVNARRRTQSPFAGSLTTQLVCRACHSKFPVGSQAFSSLSLSVPASPSYAGGGGLFRPAGVESLLRQLLGTDMIEDVKCEHCLRRSVFYKRSYIGKLPTCLCIHLSRACWSGQSRSAVKVSGHVTFPELLHLDQFTFGQQCQTPTESVLVNGCTSNGMRVPSLTLSPSTSRAKAQRVYRLCSVVVHRGDGTDNGHFITYRRSTFPSHSTRWFMVSDTSVTCVSRETVFASCAYMLFYERHKQ